jgi:hypothetical protein
VYQSSYTGGFVDVGGFQATLWVPPELYDRANGDFREPIGDACAAVVVGEPFLGLNLRVRRPPYDSEWTAKAINSLEPRWVSSERVGKTEVGAGAGNADTSAVGE